jgi:hypothetical protein
MKPGELLATEKFQLEKTMSAFEVMDQKMDFRLKAREAMTPRKALRLNVIKPASALSPREVRWVSQPVDPWTLR